LFRLNIKIITNSHAGRDFIIKKTPSAANKISVITNGLDFGTNQFSQAGRQDFRSGLGITDNDILIGHVGRYDPMKDHKTLIKAAAIVTQQVPNCYFLCWGHGDPAYTQALKDYAKSHNVDIIWYSGNSFPCYSAFDLYCLTSIGEGYSNTLTEAMAHGIPCIIGPYGSIIPASSSKDLATAILKKISEKNIIPNHQQINYSRHNFAVEKLITNTEKEFY
jgi:glycosyltransferase involved in cell wall biosynthesis